MFVKLKTTMAGPSGTAQAGAVIEVSEENGRELLEGGYATFEGPSEKSAESPSSDPEGEKAAELGETPAPAEHDAPTVEGDDEPEKPADGLTQLEELLGQE